ncbi:hypothetical protein ACFL1M_04615, partial [Patescibacteria group bacterium]
AVALTPELRAQIILQGSCVPAKFLLDFLVKFRVCNKKPLFKGLTFASKEVPSYEWFFFFLATKVLFMSLE